MQQNLQVLFINQYNLSINQYNLLHLSQNLPRSVTGGARMTRFHRAKKGDMP
jgi:hypothetical protein